MRIQRFNGKTVPDAVELLHPSNHNYNKKGTATKKNIAFSLSLQRKIERRRFGAESEINNSINELGEHQP